MKRMFVVTLECTDQKNRDTEPTFVTECVGMFSTSLKAWKEALKLEVASNSRSMKEKEPTSIKVLEYFARFGEIETISTPEEMESFALIMKEARENYLCEDGEEDRLFPYGFRVTVKEVDAVQDRLQFSGFDDTRRAFQECRVGFRGMLENATKKVKEHDTSCGQRVNFGRNPGDPPVKRRKSIDSETETELSDNYPEDDDESDNDESDEEDDSNEEYDDDDDDDEVEIVRPKKTTKRTAKIRAKSESESESESDSDSEIEVVKTVKPSKSSKSSKPSKPSKSSKTTKPRVQHISSDSGSGSGSSSSSSSSSSSDSESERDKNKSGEEEEEGGDSSDDEVREVSV